MITRSVGRNSANRPADVRTIKQCFNLQGFLDEGVSYDLDSYSGSVSKALIEAIVEFQERNVPYYRDRKAPGYIAPRRSTIQHLWPVEFAHPTNKPVRVDKPNRHGPGGNGHYGSTRWKKRRGVVVGTRKHKGSDFSVKEGQNIAAPMSGKVTRQVSTGKRGGRDVGLEIIASDGSVCKILYLKAAPDIVGEVVFEGTVIGKAMTDRAFHAMYDLSISNHVHVQIKRSRGYVNPEALITPPKVKSSRGCRLPY